VPGAIFILRATGAHLMEGFCMKQHLSKASLRALLAVAAMGVGLGLAMPGSAATDDSVSDSQITAQVKEQMAGEPTLKGADIDVKTVRRVVTLSGTVSDPHAKFAAAAAAIRVPGVLTLDDDLKVASDRQKVASVSSPSPTRSATRHSRDERITLDVRQALAESLPGHYKVDVKTTDGVVHLRGDLKDQDAIAFVKGRVEQVDGVKSVDTSELEAPYISIAY
jgi:hyperosmotically inducible periplasmic protein